MMSQYPRRQADVERADPVLDAAMDAMADLGPTRLTMAEVARRSGVSRMTVYRRYRSQRELVSAVLTAEMADVLAEVSAASPQQGPVRERVVAQSIGVVTTLLEHTLLQRVLALDPAALLPLLVERIGSGQRLLRDHLAEQLAGGMATRGGDGSVRDGDPRLLSLTLLTMAQQFVIGMRPLADEYPHEVLVAELRTAFDRYLEP